MNLSPLALLIIVLLFDVTCGIVDKPSSDKEAKTPRETLLVVSLDGLRSDKLEMYLKQNASAALNAFAKRGLKAEFMTPQFPSSTFANHQTLVTGLHAESHGIVGDAFYDPVTDVRADFVEGENKYESTVWAQAEPIWMSARKQNLTTGAFWWPGADVWPWTPDIFTSIGRNFTARGQVDQIVSWIQKFKLDMVFLYFSEPDSAGHSYGPDSTQYMNMIIEMDAVMGYLFKKLTDINMYEAMNIVILSDHGMSTAIGSPLLVTNYVNASLIDFRKSVLSKVSNVYAANKSEESILYDGLSKIPNVTVYYKNSIPKEYYYMNSNRIAPILVVCDEGYTLTTCKDKEVIPGLHGYNNSLQHMQTVFMAAGPSFKKGKTMDGFLNIHVYSLLCTLANIKCNANNGTVRVFDTYFISEAHFLNADMKLKWILSSMSFLIVYFEKL